MFFFFFYQVPTTLGEEKAYNPFLRCDNSYLLKYCEIQETSEDKRELCLRKLRLVKDNFDKLMKDQMIKRLKSKS